MIPVPPPQLRGWRESDPGDRRLCLLPGCVLGRLEVIHGDLDAQHALAAVAHEVERLGPDDLAGYCLPVSAALTRHDRSHHSSAGPANPVRKAPELPTGRRRRSPIHGTATPSLQICDQVWSALVAVGPMSGSSTERRRRRKHGPAAAMMIRIAPSAATTRA